MGIINTIKDFIVGRGFTLMIIGISAAAAGVLLYAILNTPRYAAFYYPQAAVGIFFLGLAIYATGRVSVGLQRSENKRKAAELLSRRDYESDFESVEPPPRRDDASFEPPPRNNGESGAK